MQSVGYAHKADGWQLHSPSPDMLCLVKLKSVENETVHHDAQRLLPIFDSRYVQSRHARECLE